MKSSNAAIPKNHPVFICLLPYNERHHGSDVFPLGGEKNNAEECLPSKHPAPLPLRSPPPFLEPLPNWSPGCLIGKNYPPLTHLFFFFFMRPLSDLDPSPGCLRLFSGMSWDSCSPVRASLAEDGRWQRRERTAV